MSSLNYNTIERPYDNNMVRAEDQSTVDEDGNPMIGGGLADQGGEGDYHEISGGGQQGTIDGGSLKDVWLETWIKSREYKPGVSGFMIDGRTGNAEFANIVLSGGLLSYGKSGFSDSVNAGYVLSSEGVYIGAAADATMFKYTISSGVLEFIGAHSSGTVGGQNVSDVANVANPTADTIPTDLAVSTSGITIGSEGTQTAYITLTWTGVVSTTIDQYQIRYKKSSLMDYLKLDDRFYLKIYRLTLLA
jgi:hypothetical protein